MAKFFGKILYSLARGITWVFNLLINLMNIIVVIFEGLRQILFFVFILGCSTLFFFPIVIFPLFSENRGVWIFLLSLIIIPLLGPKFISFLRYANYTITERMFDKANSMITGQKIGYENLSDYSNKYKYEQEQQRRRAYEEQMRAQQEEMNRRFEEFARNFRFDNTSSGYGNYRGGYTGGYNQGFPGVNDLGFKEKYEESCRVLGVPFDTDIYEVKLNYRKLAKKYHPDINNSPNATEMFTKVSDAHEFLTEENIKKYKQLYR